MIGENTYLNPTISTPVHATNPPNLDLELLPPAGIRSFRKGDRIELDLELITLPRNRSPYLRTFKRSRTIPRNLT